MPRILGDEDCDAIVQKLIERLAFCLARSEGDSVKKGGSAPASAQEKNKPPVSNERYVGYVRGPELLKILWGPESRPSMRTLSRMKERRMIPYVRLGRGLYYDPNEVKKALDQWEIRARF
jgi:hypothetical protein